ncbi:MAG: translation elongation factor Ts [Anaerolineae bacterium]|nr:translation elongation factor Ts [Anaerolineae bacterium]
MTVSIEMIKQLRELTGAGVLDCKKALEQTEGDLEAASEILKQKGLAAAAKKANRVAGDGLVEAYVHAGGKLGVLVEVNCETDFVARTDEFQTFCHDVAMQIAAVDPKWISRDDVPEDVLDEQKDAIRAELAGENKPEHVMDRIIEGKLRKFYEKNCLLDQQFIRNEDQTVQQLLTETIAKLGENIVIARFARFQIG